MWIVCTLLTFLFWGIADLFYKKGNISDNKYNHLKTGIIVGIVMFIHASIVWIFSKTAISFMDVIKYLPVSLCYISSMVIGYRGLKYLELSLSSPIQNTSGVITALLLILFFKEEMNIWFYPALALIFVGIIVISLDELKENKEDRKKFRKNNPLRKILGLTILFPLTYCLLDGLGTFLDALYLDELELISEEAALIAYEYTFFAFAIVACLYLKIKKEPLRLLSDKNKIFAALFETFGQFVYVYAMAGNSVIAAPIVGSYCILSMILSRIFLKEKLTKKEYFAISLVVIGIIILSILDV